MTPEHNPTTIPDPARHWADEIHDVFKELDISMMSFVPDSGHTRLITLCQMDPVMSVVPLTTEEEGVAFSAGAYLGGQRAALLMQSSGVGNCINMLSLIKACAFPFVTLVTMRGEWGEFNPWQLTMGQGAAGALESVGVSIFRAEREDDVRETVWAGAKLAFDSYCPVAILLSQRLIGSKAFQE
jgi:sulfopyruvate decarboxylase alpha subunit